jgi:hypothetical protein
MPAKKVTATPTRLTMAAIKKKVDRLIGFVL